jgi:hypothetical protein
MTYALTLVKGKAEKRDLTLSKFISIRKSDELEKKSGARIEKVFSSFGWPDFVLLIKAKNIEQIRYAINIIRKEVAKHGDYIETSSIICSTPDEMKKKRKEWSELV